MMKLRKKIGIGILALVGVGVLAAGGGRAEKMMPMHGMPGLEQMQKLKGELQLSSSQAALWQAAEDASKQAREQMRSQHEKMRALIEAERDKEVLDLRSLEVKTSALRETGQQLHQGVKEKWLAAYDSLSLSQKKTVSEQIKRKMRHFAKLGERFDRHAKRAAPEAEHGHE